MNTEMVAPSQLHRSLERVKDAESEKRKNALDEVLESKNLAVIRRIPKLLSPLSKDEKEMVAHWAERLTGGEDVSDRDFGFHLMANCKVPTQRILAILEKNKTFSRSALEHIQQVLAVDQPIQRLNDYLYEVAETLLMSEEIRPRDRGRHMLMTLAKDECDWFILADRFSVEQISDLRQRVIERFLNECPRSEGALLFINNLVKMCFNCIDTSAREDVHKEATHMHWVLMCLEFVDEKEKHLQIFISKLEDKFGIKFIPHSVLWRIEKMLPKCPKPVFQQDPTPIVKKAYSETNAQIATRLGITKRQAAKMRTKGKLE